MVLSDDITNLLKVALDEDLGAAGDITSQAIFDDGDVGEALIRGKQSGVLSGVSLIAPWFELVDSRLASTAGDRDGRPYGTVSKPVSTKIEIYCADGDVLEPGKNICRIRGAVKSILAGERVILNLLQRLSGIATATARMVDAIKAVNGGKTRLLDTRKTTPGLRALEKAAVRHGGGVNHRFGLYDMVMIKDTHVKRAGGVRAALEKALAARGNKGTPLIEIEVQSVEEFFLALPLKPDRIMLDNMSPRDIKACVDGRGASGLEVELEASGNISLAVIPEIAAAGADFISCGAITHSAGALDIHLVMV